MRRTALALLTASFAAAAPAAAQEGLSLQDAVDQALRSNLALEAARRELRVLDGRVIQAGVVANPEVEVDIDKLSTGGLRSGDAGRHVGVEQEVPLWGKRALRARSTRAELEAAQARHRARQADVVRQVKEAYWNLSLVHERVNLAEANLKFQQRFLGQVQDRFQSGQAKLADVSRARLEVARATNDLLVARKNVMTVEADLNRLMGQDVAKPLPAPQHLQESILTLDEGRLVREALRNRAERAAAAALKEGARADELLALRLPWAPDLRAGLQYQRGERADARDSWGWRLGLIFPLWHRYRGERLSAEARLASLDVQEKDIDQQIALEVHKALLELNLSAAQIQLWKQAVDQATEGARLAEQQYLEGDADILISIQARRDLVSTTLEYLGELRDYKVLLAILEQAVGKNPEG